MQLSSENAIILSLFGNTFRGLAVPMFSCDITLQNMRGAKEGYGQE